MEKSPKKGQLSTELTSLHALVYDLQTKIDKLNMECPADWSAAKKEIDKARQELVEKINIWIASTLPVAGWEDEYLCLWRTKMTIKKLSRKPSRTCKCKGSF